MMKRNVKYYPKIQRKFNSDDFLKMLKSLNSIIKLLSPSTYNDFDNKPVTKNPIMDQVLFNLHITWEASAVKDYNLASNTSISFFSQIDKKIALQIENNNQKELKSKIVFRQILSYNTNLLNNLIILKDNMQKYFELNNDSFFVDKITVINSIYNILESALLIESAFNKNIYQMQLNNCNDVKKIHEEKYKQSSIQCIVELFDEMNEYIIGSNLQNTYSLTQIDDLRKDIEMVNLTRNICAHPWDSWKDKGVYEWRLENDDATFKNLNITLIKLDLNATNLNKNEEHCVDVLHLTNTVIEFIYIWISDWFLQID